MREFIIPQALHFYLDVAGETTILADARAIAGYILAHQVERVTYGSLTTNCRRPCRGKAREDVMRMLEPLEMFGWLHREDNAPIPKAWQVDPKVHEAFASKAAEEQQRRAQVRELLQPSKETT